MHLMRAAAAMTGVILEKPRIASAAALAAGNLHGSRLRPDREATGSGHSLVANRAARAYEWMRHGEAT